MAEFENKTAIVTGAAKGLGKAIAIDLFNARANVVLADRDIAEAQALAKRLDASQKRAYPFRVDVSDPDAVQALVEETVSRFGGLHLAVNNAGLTGPRGTRTADYGLQDWKDVIDTNLNGIFYCLKYEIPEILKSGGGAIVNMSSGAGAVGQIGTPAYVASKHAIVGLTKAVALEYATENIRVNAIGPGYVETETIQALPQEVRDAMANLHPMNRLAKTREVADMVHFLLSDKASFATGAFYLLDGGYAAR